MSRSSVAVTGFVRIWRISVRGSVFLALLTLASPSVWADGDALESAAVRETVFTPEPNPQIRELWIRDLFETTDTLWFFRDQTTFENILATSELSPRLQVELRAAFKEEVSPLEFRRSLPFHGLDRFHVDGFVFVPAELWARLPRDFIERVYQYQVSELGFLPEYYVENDTWEEVEAFFRKHDLPEEHRTALRHSTVFFEGTYNILIEPATWRYLPRATREQVVELALTPHESRETISRMIRVSWRNLRQVSERYAGGRDPATLERYLRGRLREAREDALWIELEELLEPFIRERVGTYTECSGPNCINAGINAHRGVLYRIENSSVEELFRWAREHMRFVRPEENLQTGDILVYEGPDEDESALKVRHVGIYIYGDLIFTKNGLNKFNPYVVQGRAANEAIYFDRGRFNLIVFRRPRGGESAVGASERTVYHRLHPELSYLQIRYNPEAHYGARRSSLLALSRQSLTPSQFGELERLAEDPRAQDLESLVRRILNRQKQVMEWRETLQRIGFQVDGEPRANRAALFRLRERARLSPVEREALQWLHRTHQTTYAEAFRALQQSFGLRFESRKSALCAGRLMELPPQGYLRSRIVP